SADGATGQTVHVKVIDNTSASCVFESPTAGQTPTHDGDATLAGFQTGITVACAGTTVQPAGPVRLQVFQGPQVEGTPVLTVPQSLSSGKARFESITLPEGQVTLRA